MQHMIARPLPATALIASLTLAGLACISPTSPPEEPEPLTIDGDVRILFVGNSLTYTNDLPGTVEAVAAAAGLNVGTGTVAQPNYSLEDHWDTGIRQVILTLAPDYVVMQQGPSSTAENQAHLRAWARTLDQAVDEAGGESVLLMVWPSEDAAERFDAVRDSYANAAVATDGWFVPVGEAYRALLDGPSTESPYSADGFHPSPLGTVLAAFVLVGTLLDQTITGLPLEMTAPDGAPSLSITQGAADLLHPLADSVVAAWAGVQPGS